MGRSLASRWFTTFKKNLNYLFSRHGAFIGIYVPTAHEAEVMASLFNYVRNLWGWAWNFVVGIGALGRRRRLRRLRHFFAHNP